MTDPRHAPFLAAIAAAPDDDAPRLVFSDWLDEHGEPERAELIRVQCEMWRLWPHVQEFRPADAPDPPAEWGPLAARERALLDASDDWFGLPDAGADPVYWRRGFVEGVRLPAADWLQHADAILAAHPTVRGVTLTTLPDIGALTPGPMWHRADLPADATRFGGRPATIEGIATALLHDRWPGITFTLPEPAGGYVVPLEFIPALMEAMRRGEVGTIVGDPIQVAFPTHGPWAVSPLDPTYAEAVARLVARLDTPELARDLAAAERGELETVPFPPSSAP